LTAARAGQSARHGDDGTETGHDAGLLAIVSTIGDEAALLEAFKHLRAPFTLFEWHKTVSSFQESFLFRELPILN